MPAAQRARANGTRKTCFIIAPIGAEGSAERIRSDRVFRHIFEPCASECGYLPVRADHIAKPGLIPSQVINHLLTDPLVIADLTGTNPNVFYELGIRHAVRKPVLQIIGAGEKLPFDVGQVRTIQLDYQDLDSAKSCGLELVKQIRAIEADPSAVESPVSNAVDVRTLGERDDLTSKLLGQVISDLEELTSQVKSLAPPKPSGTVLSLGQVAPFQLPVLSDPAIPSLQLSSIWDPTSLVTTPHYLAHQISDSVEVRLAKEAYNARMKELLDAKREGSKKGSRTGPSEQLKPVSASFHSFF